MILHDALDRALARAARDEGRLLQARARWRELAGEVYDDEPLFEERAAAFLEWYLVDHREASAPPPIAALIDGAADPAERRVLVAIASSHHSVFAVRELTTDGVALDDLWGGGQFHVHERRRLAGLSPGELFEARLCADVEAPPRLLFTRTFCFHPREARAAIVERIGRARAAGETREAMLFRLLRLRVRCERYRHVAAARVYGADETRQ
jgi:hypothetical protein